MALIAENKELLIEKLTLGPWGTNAYIVTCQKTGASAVIDTPANPEIILEMLISTTPKYILLTHNHPDHIGALSTVHTSLGVPLAAHPDDSHNLPVKPETALKGGEVLDVGEVKIEVIHTPGHTPGSLCFKVGPYLLSGDTLFEGGPGRTGTPEALAQILNSITEKLFVLPDETPVFTGHGDPTVIKKAKDEYAVFVSREHDPGLCGDIVWLTS